MSSKTLKANANETASAPKKSLKLIAITTGFILVVIFILAFGVKKANAPFAGLKNTQAQLAGQNFTLAVADTAELRAQGLGNRQPLNQGQGMLFSFDESDHHCFWMKDVNYSIDILWFDEAKRLTHIESDVAPETYPNNFCPDKPAKYVVELLAGSVNSLQIQEGDELKISDF